MLDGVERHIEAILFTAEKPVTLQELTECLDKLTPADEFIDSDQVEASIQRLSERYQSAEYSFHLTSIAEGYCFMTKPDYHASVALFLNLQNTKKLSRAALETLAIIAYKQPVSKAEMEQIRGVNCDYSVNKLLEKDLIQISGRSEGPGRPLLYTTSDTFMDYFGLASKNDLPKLRDIHPTEDNEIGEPERNDEAPDASTKEESGQ